MIRFIIILAIGVLALSYFGISLRHIIESPTGQDNISFAWQLIQNGWHIIVTWFASLGGIFKVAPHST